VRGSGYRFGNDMTALDLGKAKLRTAATRISDFMTGLVFAAQRHAEGLYARALLIIIVPMVLLHRWWLSYSWSVIGIRLRNASRTPSCRTSRRSSRSMVPIHRTPIMRKSGACTGQTRTAVDFLPVTTCRRLDPNRSSGCSTMLCRKASAGVSPSHFWIDTVGRSALVEVRIKLDDKVMRVFARRSAAYASNSEIFFIWMVGTSVV